MEKKAVYQADTQVFSLAEKKLAVLPWNASVQGPAATTSRMTKHLRLFLSDDKWLSDMLIDMMPACLVTDLYAKPADIIIANTCFSNAILRFRETHWKSQNNPLEKFAESAGTHRYLYAPIYTEGHYIALEIDFETKSFRYSNSLASRKPPQGLIAKLNSWLSSCFGTDFTNDGPTLPHGHQMDTVSCDLFTINTIEHNVFGYKLGIANPAAEHARWFCSTLQDQMDHQRAPLALDASNNEVGPSSHPGLLVGHHLHVQKKLYLWKQQARKQHEKVEKAECEKAEWLECEKAEAEWLEQERVKKAKAKPLEHSVDMNDVDMNNNSMDTDMCASQPTLPLLLIATHNVLAPPLINPPTGTIPLINWSLPLIIAFNPIPHLGVAVLPHQDHEKDIRGHITRILEEVVTLLITSQPLNQLEMSLATPVIHPIAGPLMQALSAMPSAPGPSSLAPIAPSQVLPLANMTSIAGFNRMSHFAADTAKTHWLIQRLGQFDAADTVDLVHPDYPFLHVVSHSHDIDDMVTNADIDLLLGSTGNSSLWPPIDVFEKCPKWQGEWTKKWED
ncbi:uncharacterized protein EDB91DRAFT_1255416 [Suillus paluster]|uniref:uncharacterized protein n=1 Tax=Suillus paluster TaxID=48578 RepID=UPI001B8838DA|nr:uncharacterized protein EDB91DRAFT_1255416 [Suillus paluster]KAG1724045.1 hypothetical protein EDB91DRAFT_1255416 [Suillus paluster]